MEGRREGRGDLADRDIGHSLDSFLFCQTFCFDLTDLRVDANRVMGLSVQWMAHVITTFGSHGNTSILFTTAASLSTRK